MFFNNLTLFRFPAANVPKLARLEHKLAEHALRPCGPLELGTRGWVSPFGRGEDALSHQVGAHVLLCLGGEDKLLPGSVVNHALGQKLEKLEQQRGKPVGGRERRKLKDEVLTELMPQAMVRPSRLMGYIDTATGWVVVNTASRKRAETFISKLREALGSWPCVQAEAEESPRAVMTEWLITFTGPDWRNGPKGWAPGDACVLKDPADHGAMIRARDQDMQSEEIREHLRAGKQVTELAIIWNDRLRFTLDENLTLRKFALLDVATESLESGDRASANAELDARFALMSMEVAQLLQDLEQVFGVPRPHG